MIGNQIAKYYMRGKWNTKTEVVVLQPENSLHKISHSTFTQLNPFCNNLPVKPSVGPALSQDAHMIVAESTRAHATWKIDIWGVTQNPSLLHYLQYLVNSPRGDAMWVLIMVGQLFVIMSFWCTLSQIISVP